ncbi:MAG: hypothetical protein ACAI38_25480 [Myxococcota bacterium]
MDVKLEALRDAAVLSPAPAQPAAVAATLSDGITLEAFLAAHTEAAKSGGSGATGKSGKCPFSGGARHLGLTEDVRALAEAALRDDQRST